MARPTSACAKARGVVGAVAGHRDEPPLALLPANQDQFLLGRRFGDELVDAGLGRDGSRGDRIVAGDHDGADRHLAQLLDALTNAGLQRVGESDDAQDVAVDADGERRRSLFGHPIGDLLQVGRRRSVERLGRVANDRAHRAFADDPSVGEVDAAHAGLRREIQAFRLIETGQGLGAARHAGRDDGSPLRRRVEVGGEERGLNQVLLLTPRDGDEIARLAIAGGDGSGLVEDQRLDVAGRFDRLARHRQHVEPHRAVDGGDADRREQRADRRRDERDEQRDEIGDIDLRLQVGRHRRDRRHDDDEDQRQNRQQHGKRDLVGRLLPLGGFDEADHPIEERVAGVGGDAEEQPVGDDRRPGGDRREHVGSRLLEHRRGFAGDGGLVDVGDALDDVAVGRDDAVLLHPDEVALAQVRRRNGLDAPAGEHAVGAQVGAGLAQRGGLRLAAAFGQRLGVVGEPDGQHEDDRHHAVVEARGAGRSEQVRNEGQREGQQRAEPDDEHHGVADLDARVELDQRFPERLPQQFGGVGAFRRHAAKFRAERAALRGCLLFLCHNVSPATTFKSRAMARR